MMKGKRKEREERRNKGEKGMKRGKKIERKKSIRGRIMTKSDT